VAEFEGCSLTFLFLSLTELFSNTNVHYKYKCQISHVSILTCPVIPPSTSENQLAVILYNSTLLGGIIINSFVCLFQLKNGRSLDSRSCKDSNL